MERPPAHAHHLGQHVALRRAVVGDADSPADVPDAELPKHLREGQELFLGGDVAGKPATVLGAVLQVLVSRESKGSSLHGFVENLFHLVSSSAVTEVRSRAGIMPST